MARDRNRKPPPAPDLPNLTAKQLKFVEGLIAGLTGSDAYRQAYDASGMSPTSISAEAARMRRHPDVQAWYHAWAIAHMTEGVLTKEQHLRELAAIRELGKAEGDLKTAVAAEHLRGKVSGHYVERSEVHVYDPAAILAQIRQMDPAIASLLAARFNLALPSADAAGAVDGVEDLSEVIDVGPVPPPVPGVD